MNERKYFTEEKVNELGKFVGKNVMDPVVQSAIEEIRNGLNSIDRTSLNDDARSAYDRIVEECSNHNMGIKNLQALKIADAIGIISGLIAVDIFKGSDPIKELVCFGLEALSVMAENVEQDQIVNIAGEGSTREDLVDAVDAFSNYLQ